MLEWKAAGSGPRFMLLVHHTDGVREYAYDRNARFENSTRLSMKRVQRVVPWSV